MKTLKELLKYLEVKEIVNANGIVIEGIAYDSRKVKKNFLFVCLKGAHADGHDFINDAIARNASAVVVSSSLHCGAAQRGTVPRIIVSDTRTALSKLASAFYDFPARSLKVIGVTGTDGKTTTAFYVKSILEEAGIKTGLIGTINYELGERILPADRTTPESLDLQFLFNQMLNQGLTHAVMEVSSHSLSQSRVDEIDFKTAVFTNLSHEHLDFHNGMDEYFLAKKRLFEKDIEKGVVNIDDEFGKKLKDFLGDKSLSFGISADADLKAYDINPAMDGTKYKVKCAGLPVDINLALIGRHNVHNSLAAMGVGIHLGIPLDVIKRGLEKVKNIPGRFEVVRKKPFTVIVDYAHTPRALENALTELRHLCSHRLILVFGCGGDRDPAKRPKMGEIAACLADYTIVTSDNPRTENPLKIIHGITTGMVNCPISLGSRRPAFGEPAYSVEPDREKAISMALTMAKPNDCVLIAGKGHEKYQIKDNVYLPFDDVHKVRSILNV